MNPHTSAGLVVFVAAMLTATAAAAQSVVISGGYYRESKSFSGDPAMGVLDTEVSGLHLAVGALAMPRVLVALELGQSEESGVTRSTTISYLGRDVEIRTQYANRLTTWSALAGVRGAPAGRLQLTYLGGLTFFHMTRRITPESQPVILQPAPPPIVSTTHDNVAGPVVGVVAAVRAARHVAVVFLVRAHALTVSTDLSGFIVRPGMAVQVSF